MAEHTVINLAIFMWAVFWTDADIRNLAVSLLGIVLILGISGLDAKAGPHQNLPSWAEPNQGSHPSRNHSVRPDRFQRSGGSNSEINSNQSEGIGTTRDRPPWAGGGGPSPGQCKNNPSMEGCDQTCQQANCSANLPLSPTGTVILALLGGGYGARKLRG